MTGHKTKKSSAIKIIFIIPIAALILLWGLWFIAIPDSTLSDLMENSLKDSNIGIHVTNLKKGLFFNLAVGRLELSKSGKTLFSIEDVKGGINPLSLFIMRLSFHFSGNSGGGKIYGGIDLFRGKNHVYIKIAGARLEGIPFFALMGLDGRGMLSGDLNLDNGQGDIKLDFKEMALQTGTFSGVSVPLEMFDSARGAFSIEEGVTNVDSFSLEGKDIYARVKGTIAGGSANLTMEIMPDKELIANNPVFSLLNNYKVSPGFYSIPINAVPQF